MFSKVHTCDTKCLWSMKKKTLRKNKSELGFSCTAWIPKILCKDVYFLFVIPDDDIQYVAKKTTLRLLNNIVFQCITFMICLDSHLSKIQKIKQATGIYEKREVFW